MPRISTGGMQITRVQIDILAYSVWLNKHFIQIETTPAEDSEPEKKLPQSAVVSARK